MVDGVINALVGFGLIGSFYVVGVEQRLLYLADGLLSPEPYLPPRRVIDYVG